MWEGGGALLAIVRDTGPLGAVLAAIVVALVLGVIILANTAGLFRDMRSGAQSTRLADQLLAAVAMLTETERNLRAQMEDLLDDNGKLRSEVAALTVTVDLLRNQGRRTLEQLKAVMDGRLAPSAIVLGDLGGGPPA